MQRWARTTTTPTPRSGSATRIPIRSGAWANSSAPSCPTPRSTTSTSTSCCKVHEHALKAYAGQMFHLLCPSPDGAEVWMRRPMSVYRVDRAAGQIEFLYKTEGRGTRGMALLAPGDDFNVAGPLGVGFKLDPAWKNHRGARPRRRAGDAGAAVATGGRERRRRHRDPERAPCRRRHVAGAVRQSRRPHHHGARFRQHQRGRERREDHRGPDRARARPTPSSPAAPTAC